MYNPSFLSDPLLYSAATGIVTGLSGSTNAPTTARAVAASLARGAAGGAPLAIRAHALQGG
eukprot:gene7905-2251_t